MAERLAIVLFNLGGPDRAESVRPFLFNLFNDPAILRLPFFVRTPLAWLIAKLRAPKAALSYREMGGGSPILGNTELQARALEAALGGAGVARCFIAMRYWHPLTEETAARVKEFSPDRIVLLPLYPQFSTTTTASSLLRWKKAAREAGLTAPTKTICCYPPETGFVAAAIALIRERWGQVAQHGRPRLLLSAHGLPEKIVAAGDPYPQHCERTAAAIAEGLGIPGLDWRLCYQSKVGPLPWIGPATDAEIRKAGAEGVPLLVFPIAFVSDHVETLVELGIEYRHLARASGVPFYDCVPAVGTHPDFIAGLAGLVRLALRPDSPAVTCSPQAARFCPSTCSECPHAL